MTDGQILDLFFDRSQEAVTAVQEQYGQRLNSLAMKILSSRQDAEECVSDTLLLAWNSIPPKRPLPLLPWLAAAVRNFALNRFRVNRAGKRGGGAFPAAVEEMDELAASAGDPARAVELEELTELLNRFLKNLPKRDRLLFLGRYWYGEPYGVIARRLGMTEKNCTVRMTLLRKKLRDYLNREGVL